MDVSVMAISRLGQDLFCIWCVEELHYQAFVVLSSMCLSSVHQVTRLYEMLLHREQYSALKQAMSMKIRPVYIKRR